jgi:hypothetical protein
MEVVQDYLQEYLQGSIRHFHTKTPFLPPSTSNPLPKFLPKSVPIYKTLKLEKIFFRIFLEIGLYFLKPNIYIIQV